MQKHSRSEGGPLEPRGAGFGKFPAWVVDKGLLAGLTHNELRLYCVLVRRAWNENRLARFTRRELERLSGVPWRVHAGVDAGLVKWGLVKVWRHGRGKVYFVPLAGPVRGPGDADPISPPGNRPHEADPISPSRDRQGRFEYATRPGDADPRGPHETDPRGPHETDPRGPGDTDTLNPKETFEESFQRDQDPLSQFSGGEDGTKTPDGPPDPEPGSATARALDEYWRVRN